MWSTPAPSPASGVEKKQGLRRYYITEWKDEGFRGMQVKHISIFRRMGMPLPALEEYYRLRRKARFEQGKKLGHVQLREVLYPLFALFIKADRWLRRQTIEVIGNTEIQKGQAIFACTHIGGNDLQSIFEVIRRGCWWFVGDPCVLYQEISGLLLYLNGCILLELTDREDRRIAYARAVELLKAGGSLMIYPEGARNGTENLPVMGLFQGTARMAMATGTKIVPVGIEQYGDRFVVNFGNALLPSDFQTPAELTQKLRDTMATLKWEIWEREGLCARADLPQNYRELFQKEFETRIYPYDTPETVERSRFHTKEEIEQRDAFAHLEHLTPCRENAFLFRER